MPTYVGSRLDCACGIKDLCVRSLGTLWCAFVCIDLEDLSFFFMVAELKAPRDFD